MSESRTKNTKRNIISGLFLQFTNIVFPFITRTAILYILGEQYQGLSSLFTSILQVLNLSDLGFSSAVVYVMYKPIAEGDDETVCAILAYLKRIYRVVGFVVLGLGLALLPALPHLINGGYPQDINIYVLYLIYLANSVLSYWLFAYKTALLTAMQRADIVNNIASATKILLYVLQIVVLVRFQNYYSYIVLLLPVTVLNNLLVEFESRRTFPKILPTGRITSDVKANLIRQVKGIVVERIGNVTRNSVDNIYLSALLGLSVVAVFNNYYYIYSAIYGVALAIANAMYASVGNSVARETTEKNYADMCKFQFIFSWFSGWCAICLACLYQPFMVMWMRGRMELLLPMRDMLLFCAYFYAITMNCIRNQYLYSVGIFWELRIWYALESITNIALNYVLGLWFGVFGILIATLLSIVLFNFLSRTNVLFQLYFKKSPMPYYGQLAIYLACAIAAGLATYAVCSLVPIAGPVGFAVRAVICMALPNALFLAMFWKTKRFQEARRFAMRVLRR